MNEKIKQLEFKNIVLQEKYDLLVYKRFVRASETQDKTQPRYLTKQWRMPGPGKKLRPKKKP